MNELRYGQRLSNAFFLNSKQDDAEVRGFHNGMCQVRYSFTLALHRWARAGPTKVGMLES